MGIDWNNIINFGKKPEGFDIDISFGIIEKLDNALIDWISQQVSNLTSLFFNLILNVPLQFFETLAFKKLYKLSIIIVLAIISPIVIYHSFKFISGKIDFNEMFSLIKKLMLAPLYIIATPYVIKNLLIIVNQVCKILLEIPDSQIFIRSESIDFGTILYVVIIIYYLFKLSLYYSGRNVLIAFITTIFPLIYLLSCIPSKYDKLDKFINELSSLILTQFVHVMQLLIMFALTDIQSNNNLVELSLKAGALWVMQNAPNWVSSYIDTKITGVSDINFNKQINFMKKTAGYLTNPKNAVKGVLNVFKN